MSARAATGAAAREPGHQDAVPEPARPAEYGRGAVDRFDLAAELEASGYNERLSRIHLDGRTLFEVADVLIARRPAAEREAGPRARVSRQDLADSVARAVLLVAGVLLVGVAFRLPGVASAGIVVASVCGWVGGQAAMAVLWARRGAGDGAGGVRAAGQCAAATTLLVAAGATAWHLAGGASVVDVAVVVGTQMYVQGIGLVVVSRWVRIAAPAVTIAAIGASVAIDAGPQVVCAIVVAVLVGVTGVAVGTWWRCGGTGFVLRDVRVIPASTLQAAVLAAGVLAAMATLAGPQTMRFVLASIVAIAVTDPLLTAARGRLRSGAATSRSWGAVAVRSAMLLVGVGVVVPLGAVGLAVAVGEREPWALTVLGLYVAVSVVSALLRSLGAPWASVAAASTFLGAAATWLVAGPTSWWPAPVALVMVSCGIVGGLMAVARWCTDPRTYL